MELRKTTVIDKTRQLGFFHYCPLPYSLPSPSYPHSFPRLLYRPIYEFFMKGYLFKKGPMKILVFQLLQVKPNSNNNNNNNNNYTLTFKFILQQAFKFKIVCTESHHNYSQFLKYNRAYIFLQLTRMICCYIFVTLLTTQCLQTLHSLKYTTHLIICNSPYTRIMTLTILCTCIHIACTLTC